MLFLRIELLDERSDTRGDGSRESLVLDPQAVPKGQPDASIASKDRPISSGSVHPRVVGNMRCRYARERRNWLLPVCRLGLIGTKFGRAVAGGLLDNVPAGPAVEGGGGLSPGFERRLFFKGWGGGRVEMAGGAG